MTVHTQLVNIQKASEITQQDKPPDMLSKRTENSMITLDPTKIHALKLTSLEA